MLSATDFFPIPGGRQICERSDLAKETMKEDYNAVYWNERYTVRDKQVPVFLHQHAKTIVTTGTNVDDHGGFFFAWLLP